MTTQTLSITGTLDDGWVNGSTFETAAPGYLGSGYAGFTFRLTAQILSGATIDKCYFRVYRLVTAGGGAWVTRTFKLESAAPGSNTRWSSSHLPDSATMLTGTSLTSGSDPAAYQSQYLFGESDSLPQNLTSDMASLSSTYGTLNVGDIINVGLYGGGSGGYGETEDYAAAGGHPAQLIITWTGGGGGPVTVAASGSAATVGRGTPVPGLAIGL